MTTETLKQDLATNYVPGSGKITGIEHRDCNNALIDGILDIISPPGEIINMATSVVPTGFHAFDGAQLSRTAYPKLFALWGTTFGEGDGINTFNCPTIETGRFLLQYGVDSVYDFSMFAKGGEKTHLLIPEEIPAKPHFHYTFKNSTRSEKWFLRDLSNGTPITDGRSGYSDNNNKYAIQHDGTDQSYLTANAGKSGLQQNISSTTNAHNNIPPYFACNFIFRLC